MIAPKCAIGRKQEDERPTEILAAINVEAHDAFFESGRGMEELRSIARHEIEEIRRDHSVSRGILRQRAQGRLDRRSIYLFGIETPGLAGNGVDGRREEKE